MMASASWPARAARWIRRWRTRQRRRRTGMPPTPRAMRRGAGSRNRAG